MSLQLSGLVGGLVATIGMSLVMMLLSDDDVVLPTQKLLAKFGGQPAAEYQMAGLVMHLLYGAGAGWVYALLIQNDLIAVLSATTVVGGLVNGLIYGLILLVVAMAFWMRTVIGHPDVSEGPRIAAGHVVYGLLLGLWIGAGVLV